MAELLKSDHEALSGGSFVPANYLGTMPTELDGIYAPPRDAQAGGFWDAAAVNWIDSDKRRTFNVQAAYIYKDSADTELQYSVRAFALDVRGMLCSYAGQVARGPLTAGVANYVYADLSAAPTITIASSTLGWPGSGGNAWIPHLRIDVITPPGSGHWKDQHRVRWLRSQAAVGFGTGVHAIKKTFAYNTASPLVIGTVGGSATIVRVHLKITTAFDGTSPTLSVGDAGDAARLMGTGDNDPKTAGVYTTMPQYEYAAQTDLKLAITPSTATVGAGFVLVEHLA